MWRTGLSSALSTFLLFASFPSSSHYLLNNYSIGTGASNKPTSTHYSLEGSTGEVVSVPSSSTNHIANSGSLQAQQISVPLAPTLSTGGGTYYDELGLIINQGTDTPSDATFAVAVSSNNFATTSYVQVDGSLNTTPFFQSYSAWGGSSGTTIIGLTPSTSYEVKVSAMQGTFDESAYGPYASASTVGPSITFSLSQNTVSFGSLAPIGSINSSVTISADFATNADSGGRVYVSDINGGLMSAATGYTITSATADLSSVSQGYGLRNAGSSQSSGGPLFGVSPYNSGNVNMVGALTTTPAPEFGSNNAIVGGVGQFKLKAVISSTTPYASDYGDTVSFVASANF